MILPSSLSSPTTDTVGYFELAPEDVARWLADGLGEGWATEKGDTANLLSDAARQIKPRRPETPPLRTAYWLFPLGGWPALLTNGPRGTDVGVLPIHFVRDLNRRAIRAVVATGRYPGVMMEVYDSRATDYYLRSLEAVNDGGRWVFGERGERFSFEESDRYTARRIRDRFTPDMLERYLLALGVPVDQDPEHVTPIIVRRQPG